MSQFITIYNFTFFLLLVTFFSILLFSSFVLLSHNYTCVIHKGWCNSPRVVIGFTRTYFVIVRKYQCKERRSNDKRPWNFQGNNTSVLARSAKIVQEEWYKYRDLNTHRSGVSHSLTDFSRAMTLTCKASFNSQRKAVLEVHNITDINKKISYLEHIRRTAPNHFGVAFVGNPSQFGSYTSRLYQGRKFASHL